MADFEKRGARDVFRAIPIGYAGIERQPIRDERACEDEPCRGIAKARRAV